MEFSPFHGETQPASYFRIPFSRLHNAPNGLTTLVAIEHPRPKVILYKFHDLKNPSHRTQEDLLDKIFVQPFDQDVGRYHFTLGPKYLLTLPYKPNPFVMGRRFYDHINDNLTSVRASTEDDPVISVEYMSFEDPEFDDKICKIQLLIDQQPTAYI